MKKQEEGDFGMVVEADQKAIEYTMDPITGRLVPPAWMALRTETLEVATTIGDRLLKLRNKT